MPCGLLILIANVAINWSLTNNKTNNKKRSKWKK